MTDKAIIGMMIALLKDVECADVFSNKLRLEAIQIGEDRLKETEEVK